MTARLNTELRNLEEMRPSALRAEWRRVFRKAAPDLSPDLMRRAIAWRLQERIHGGLSRESVRELDHLVGKLERSGSIDVQSEINLKIGTRLVREWQGKTYEVLVVEDGFVLDGRSYSSLSQVACDITGAHWSGPRFFGLRKRPVPKRGKMLETANG